MPASSFAVMTMIGTLLAARTIEIQRDPVDVRQPEVEEHDVRRLAEAPSSRAPTPVVVDATACPRSVNPRWTAARIAASSSTTRTLVTPSPYAGSPPVPVPRSFVLKGWVDERLARPEALGVAAWLPVVAVGAVLVWLVISRAGGRPRGRRSGPAL